MCGYFEWYPVGMQKVVFNDVKPYLLRNKNLTASNVTDYQDQRAPFQIGASFLNPRIDPRIFSLNVRIADVAGGSIDQYREELASKMITEPQISTVPQLGILKYVDGPRGFDLELECLPIDSPQFEQLTLKNNVVDCNIEFYAPYPFWLRDEDKIVSVEPEEEAGLEFEIEFEIEFATTTVDTVVVNEGEIEAPVIIRVYGELDGFRITNVNTNEVMEVLTTISSGEYVEINTAFGEKSIELVVEATGERTNVIGDLSFAKSNFFRLAVGVNEFKIEPIDGQITKVEFIYRERFIGV